VGGGAERYPKFEVRTFAFAGVAMADLTGPLKARDRCKPVCLERLTPYPGVVAAA